MKHHKGILYDDFMLLSRIECKKNCIFFKISKIYAAMQSGCYGDFAPIIECRTHNFKFGLTRELSMMNNIHLT